jgi:predicted RNA-binding Zn ribbon-like protein
MPVQPEDRPAPTELELVRLFVNTCEIDEEIELLPTASASTRWLRSKGLLGSRERLDEADFARLIALREALRAVLVAHAENVEAPEAVARVNAEIGRVGLAPAFEDAHAAEIQGSGKGVDGVIARLLSISLQASYDGTWGRLKACPADHCHWAFYDASKNRSSRWCHMELCGAKQKRENFRRRHPPGPKTRA